MKTIKQLLGEQNVCSTMLCLSALLLAGSCQTRSMDSKPNKSIIQDGASIQGKQKDALTQAQQQAASAGVLAQNQTQPKKPQEKTATRDALAQAQKQTETAWTSALTRTQKNQDNLTCIVGETLKAQNALLNNTLNTLNALFLRQQEEKLPVTGQSSGRFTSVTGQSSGQFTSVTTSSEQPDTLLKPPPPPPRLCSLNDSHKIREGSKPTTPVTTSSEQPNTLLKLSKVFSAKDLQVMKEKLKKPEGSKDSKEPEQHPLARALNEALNKRNKAMNPDHSSDSEDQKKWLDEEDNTNKTKSVQVSSST